MSKAQCSVGCFLVLGIKQCDIGIPMVEERKGGSDHQDDSCFGVLHMYDMHKLRIRTNARLGVNTAHRAVTVEG